VQAELHGGKSTSWQHSQSHVPMVTWLLFYFSLLCSTYPPGRHVPPHVLSPSPPVLPTHMAAS